MLHTDYGDQRAGDAGVETLKPIRHVARVWGLRMLQAMEPIRDIGVSTREAAAELGLTDSKAGVPEVVCALNDKMLCHSRLIRIEAGKPPLDGPLSNNLKLLQELFELKPAEVAALSFMSVQEALAWFHDLCAWAVRNGHIPDMFHCIAAATMLGPADLYRAMSPAGRLVNCGLVRSDIRRRFDLLDTLKLAPCCTGACILNT